MSKQRLGYRSLSVPSQILLVVFLTLCLFFTFRLFKQLDAYWASKAELEETAERLAALQARQERLQEAVVNIEREQEARVRERYDARPDETVWQISADVPVEIGPAPSASARLPVWQLWYDLFFGPD